MELRQFLSSIVRGWLVVVVCLLLGLAVVGVHRSTTLPTYSAAAKLYVDPSADNLNDAATANSLAQQLAINYAQLAATPYVLQGAAEQLGGGTTSGQLAGSVVTTVTEGTPFLTVTATSTEPATAARAANAVSASLVSATRKLRTGSSTTASLQLLSVQAATAPPASPSGGLLPELLIGAIAGLVVGAALVLLRGRLNAGFRSIAEIAVVTDGEVLGAVPEDRRAKRVTAATLHARSPARFEAFRSLRAALDATEMLPQTGTTITVTSSLPHEGKSSTVVGLAVTLAAIGREVVVVEADLRQPRVASMLGVTAGPGLTDVLEGRIRVQDAVQPSTVDHVGVLRAGPRLSNSSDLIGGAALDGLLSALTEAGAVVLVDTPPLLALADGAVVAQRTDRTLLVVGARVAKEREVARAVTVLHQVRVALAGIVVSGVPSSWSDSSSRAYRAYVTDASSDQR